MPKQNCLLYETTTLTYDIMIKGWWFLITFFMNAAVHFALKLLQNTFFHRIQDLKSHYEFERKDSLLKLLKIKYYKWILPQDKYNEVFVWVVFPPIFPNCFESIGQLFITELSYPTPFSALKLLKLWKVLLEWEQKLFQLHFFNQRSHNSPYMD